MAGEWCEPLFFVGGHVQPSQEFMQRNRSLDILVTAIFHRTLSWWGLAIRPVGEIFGMMLGWRKKSFDTRCSFLDYGGHDGLNGLEHCEFFLLKITLSLETEVLRPKIPSWYLEILLAALSFGVFFLFVFFGPKRFWSPSEDNSIAYFEHRKEQTLASCKELCRAMANRRPVIDGWDPGSTSYRWEN